MRFSTIGRAGLAFALMAALAVPTAVFTAPSTAAAATADDKLPGAALPANQPLTGAVSSSDRWDIYQLPLQAGEQLHLKLNGTAKGRAYAFLLPPGATKVDPKAAVAMPLYDAHPAHYSQTMRFGAKTGGTYSLVVFGADSKYSVTWEVAAQGTDDDVPGIPLVASHNGSLDESSDPSDVYAIDLKAGQTISAEMTKPSGADFELLAFGPGVDTVWFSKAGSATTPWPGNSVDLSSTRNETTERLFFQAPKDGTYYVQAAAFSGTGDYSVATNVLDAGSYADTEWTAEGVLAANTTINVAGRLLDKDGGVDAGETVVLEKRTGSGWTKVSEAVTYGNGGFIFAPTLDRNTTLRVRYAGEFGQTAPVVSETHTYKVQADLGTPRAPSSVRAGQKFVVKGTVGPQRSVGSRPVEVRFQKKVKGKWVVKKKVSPKVKNSGGRSAFAFKTTLPKGQWRVVVKQKETSNWVQTYSKPDYIRVR